MIVKHSGRRSGMKRVPSPAGSQTLVMVLLTVLFSWNLAFQAPWDLHHPWPTSSERPVRPLSHPNLESRILSINRDPSEGFRFAAFGDQRALAGGEWQSLVQRISEVDAVDPLLFILDTGDIVDNGVHSDQFGMLAEILRPIDHLPYLVAIGNHEVHANRDRAARENTVKFLDQLDPQFGIERMYYRKDIGSVTFLFLDSNDFVYGEDGSAEGVLSAPFEGRIAAQWEWLNTQLRSLDPERTIVVSVHHPFLQTSKKHRPVARNFWSFGSQGATLPELLIDHGVDLILVGHTHTYERFRLRRGSREMQLVNISGRPRDGFLWFGSGARKSKNIEGRETEWFTDRDWDLTGWEIRQEARMDSDERNQFALFEVDGAGALKMQIAFVGRDDEAEVEWGDPVTFGSR